MNNKFKTKFIQYLPMYGCIATGLSYIGVGVFALLSFFKVRDGGADESSMLSILNNVVIGKIMLWIILVGTACYIVWRFFEAITDPYNYGKNVRGLAKRFGIAFSTVADLLIVYAAIKVLLGTGNIQQNGEPREEREFINNLLAESWGTPIVVALGVVVIVTAVVQLIYGVTRAYKERLNLDQYSPAGKTVIYVLGWIGFGSRGVIVGITGFFLLKAAFTSESNYVVNTDKAFDFIGDHVGHVYFILLAMGTVCYGIFMLIHGVGYDHDKD